MSQDIVREALKELPCRCALIWDNQPYRCTRCRALAALDKSAEPDAPGPGVREYAKFRELCDSQPAEPTALEKLEAWKAAKGSRWYGTSEYNEDGKHWHVVRLYDGARCLAAELGPTLADAIRAALEAAGR